MRSLVLLLLAGAGLMVVAATIGGTAAVIGGGIALCAQLSAVALLRPKMRSPNPEFMARWLGGMAVRFFALVLLVVWVMTGSAVIAPLRALLGFLGVLLPLLFLETRFLR